MFPSGPHVVMVPLPYTLCSHPSAGTPVLKKVLFRLWIEAGDEECGVPMYTGTTVRLPCIGEPFNTRCPG